MREIKLVKNVAEVLAFIGGSKAIAQILYNANDKKPYKGVAMSIGVIGLCLAGGFAAEKATGTLIDTIDKTVDGVIETRKEDEEDVEEEPGNEKEVEA